MAGLVPGVPEPDVRSLPLARSAQLALAALCTRGAVPYAGRSCAAMALAPAVAQWVPMVSRLPELLVVASLLSAESPQLELQPGLRETAQRVDAPVV